MENIQQGSFEVFSQLYQHPFLISSACPCEVEDSDGEKTKLNLLKRPHTDPFYVIPLIKNLYKIGREADCDIFFPLLKVSRQHIRIDCLANGVWTVTDCCTRNGTFLNGQKINAGQPYALTDESMIDLGSDVTLIFRTPEGMWKISQHPK